MSQLRKWLVTVLVALPLFFISGFDDALAGSTLTGTIRGAVIDESGNPLPGVTVIFRSEALVREVAKITDVNGNFFAPGLAPGDYAVVAQLDGFQTIQQTTQVQLDKTTTLTFTLVAGELTESVTVVATKPVVDKTNTETSVNLNKDFTEQLPTARSYQSLLQFAPGVSGGSNPNMLGGTSNSNTYQLDGVSITDPVTGTFGSNINYDVIDAVDIKLTGISAEYGGFQGGISNVITKSGGNDFTGSMRDQVDSPSFEKEYESGSLKYFPEDRALPDGCIIGTDPETGAPIIDTANVNCFTYTRPTPQQQGDRGLAHDIQGTFGGPVVRDSAWFFLSYNRNDTLITRTLVNPTGGPFADGTYVDTFQGDNSSAKLTWQVVNAHKVQYTYFEDPAVSPRCYAGIFWGGGCYDGFTVDNQAQGGFAWTAKWDGVWGNRLLTDAKISHWENGFLISPMEPRPDYAINPDLIFESPSGMMGAGAAAGYPLTIDLNSGVGFDAPVFSTDPETREREQYEAKATMFYDTNSLGSHTFKVGVDYQEQTVFGSSILSGNALIYLDGFVEAPPGLGGVSDDPSIAYDIDNRIYFLFYDFAPPGGQGSITKNTAVFVQDDWQLNDNWSFNLGVRFEDVNNENDVGDPIFDQTGISPRLGASWDVTGEAKHVVKATAAEYLDAIELTTLGFFEQATGGQNAYDVYINANLLDEDDTNDAGTPDWELDAQIRTDPGSNTFSPDLKPQSIREYTLAYEYSMTPTLGFMVKGVKRDWNDIVGQYYDYDYTDGRVRTLLLDNKPEVERKYDAVILQAEKRYSNNWQALVNYTMQNAEGATQSTGGADQGFATYNSYPGVPQTTVNRYGDLLFSKDTANLSGSYLLPLNSKRHSLRVGGWLRWREGDKISASENIPVVVGPGPDGIQQDPLGTLAEDQGDNDDETDQVLTFASPRGSYSLPNWWRMDLSFQWNFMFSKKVNFETRLEIFNLTDEQRPINTSLGYVIDPQNASDALTNYRFGKPQVYGDFQRARRYQINFAILW